MVTSIDPNLLLNFYSSRTGSGGGLGQNTSGIPARKVAPTAPWSRQAAPIDTPAAVRAVLAGRKFVNEGATKLDLLGASADYKKLFALYQGLSTLGGLAEAAQRKGITSFERAKLEKAFSDGLTEVSDYVSSADLTKLRLTTGTVNSTARTSAPVAGVKSEYLTDPLFSGTSSQAVPQFQGVVKFSINVSRSGTLHNVDIDLAEMGAQTRSIANVVNYINGKLAADGVDTRFATQRIPGQPKTVVVGGKTITIGPGPEQWALRVKPNSETVSFSAADTAGAVYLAQGIGDPNPDGKIATNDSTVRQQLVKFQTDTTNVEAPLQTPADAHWVDGRAFAKTLGPEIKTVRATKVGPDGSVYVLADITGKSAGQDIKGTQDVALIKYDSAGKLVFERTLGAAATATGLGLAVAADGSVAIAGAVKGVLAGATDGGLNSGPTGALAAETDSFVTVFNAEGEEQWTQRRGARQADEASHLAFGADGTVYVAGRAKSALPGAGNFGDFDSYIEAFGPPNAQGKVAATFTANFGTAGADRPSGMVLDGASLVTASVENGRGVLRRFDISSGTPVLSATRDLGDLQGGEITGLALDGAEIVIAGSTTNAALAAGAITRAHAGGIDAFAARLAAYLSAGGGDAIAYYGGAGDDRASALSVAGGKVWIAGSAGLDLPGLSAVGKKDGFLANLDVASGGVSWSRRFTGKDGQAAPSAITATTAGASSLDRLGLPSGAFDLIDSQQITAATSIRAGDQFTVRSGSGRASTITIDAAETLTTLSQKIRRASGFLAKLTFATSDGVRKLTIAPQTGRTLIEFGAGPPDKDALEFLGLPEGVVRDSRVVDGKTVPADGKGQIYGLGLPSKLNLSDPKEISHAAAEVAAAMGVIRSVYKDLVAAADPRAAQVAAARASGPVPAYLTNQIANYQAALARLGG